MIYHFKRCSRNGSSVAISLVALVFSIIAVILLITAPGARLFAGFFGAFSLSAACYSLYFLINPVTWELTITDNVLRWKSPHLPRQTKEVRITDITAARNTRGEMDTVELTTISGAIICIPLSCVEDPRALLNALGAENKDIQLTYEGQRIIGFSPNRWVGLKPIPLDNH